jgi:hypothetical protein
LDNRRLIHSLKSNWLRDACRFSLRCEIAFLLAALALSGCVKSGPELAPVSGRVTLDGKPLENADVVFQPENPGSPSYGRTAADGSYELGYKQGIAGALVGKHTVSIRVSPEVVRNAPKIARVERRVEVLEDENVFNFDEKSAK